MPIRHAQMEQLALSRNEIFSKKNVLYFVELSKFAAQLETLDMADERNHWLYMLTQAVHLNQNDVEAMTPVFQRFYEECQIAKFTDMDKRNYVRNVLEFEDVKEMMECEREFAEQAGYERGVQEGMLQGIEKGMEKGREEGIEVGEKQALLQSLKTIMETLNLTKDQAMDVLKVPEAEREYYLSHI